ncbi:bacteriocin-associated integral membrane family protein, partial [Staphylococcus hominis]
MIFVNQQFRDLYNKYYPTGLTMNNNKDVLEVILPNKYKDKFKQVNKEYQEWFNTLKDKHNKDGKLNINLTNKDDYHIFSFNNRS